MRVVRARCLLLLLFAGRNLAGLGRGLGLGLDVGARLGRLRRCLLGGELTFVGLTGLVGSGGFTLDVGASLGRLGLRRRGRVGLAGTAAGLGCCLGLLLHFGAGLLLRVGAKGQQATAAAA